MHHGRPWETELPLNGALVYRWVFPAALQCTTWVAKKIEPVYHYTTGRVTMREIPGKCKTSSEAAQGHLGFANGAAVVGRSSETHGEPNCRIEASQYFHMDCPSPAIFFLISAQNPLLLGRHSE